MLKTLNVPLNLGEKKKDDGKICPSLTFRERLIGFAVCFIVGYTLSVMSTLSVIFGKRDMVKFGVFYTLGNLIALAG